MKENVEKQHHPEGRRRILQALAFLGAFTIVPPSVNSNTSGNKEDRGDKVHCVLTKISSDRQQAKYLAVRDIRLEDINYEPTGEIITFSGQNFEVIRSEEYGNLLKDEKGALFVIPDPVVTRYIVGSLLAEPKKTSSQ